MKPQIQDRLKKKYELACESDPASKAFAALAEIYRKAGFLERALNICKNGIAENKYFVSGYMVLAKVYLDLKDIPNAIDFLNKVISLSPDSIKAYKLLAELYLKEAEMRSALKAFEYILFLNPYDNRAKTQIARIKKLLIEDEDQFKMKQLVSINSENFDKLPAKLLKKRAYKLKNKKHLKGTRILERYLSLIDAYILRNEIDKAIETIKEAEHELGKHDQLTKKYIQLSSRFKDTQNTINPDVETKIEILESILDRVQEKCMKRTTLEKV